MTLHKFDLTPDPNVLIALTRTPLQQMDAICELIDNAIDSFNAAKRQGIVIDNPMIKIDLPKTSDIDEDKGCVRILDNGPGLTAEEMEMALRAGYSSNNQFDNLGLFGMGFNISTGKIGGLTRVTSARVENDNAIIVSVDLNSMNQNKSYFVEPVEEKKVFAHGTEVVISNWWPQGNPNNGFIKKLAGLSKKKIREQIGRRYATILRETNIKILVNDVPCEPYRFCVWDAKRSVYRQKYGNIPARYDFDQIVFSQRKCSKCGALLDDYQSECPNCSGREIRTVPERIWGWVGIQRYDSQTEYGIDLVRNGRTIRVAEKSAFFEFVNEFGETIPDYPIDTNYGRIIGEVHLDHVPVDFQKQDFQRSTPEWQRAMSYLRGDSSLQPTQPGADSNKSPIFMLYQGYRKVGTAGKRDLYMGYWDVVKNGPHRISREVEKEFIDHFRAGDEEYLDDHLWWEQVENADHEPIKPLPICPECGAQILESSEVCNSCGYVLKGKKCISCYKTIPASAKICPECGAGQDIEVIKPWKCEVCHKQNLPTIKVCSYCGSEKGAINSLSKEYLLMHSNKNDELSIEDCSVKLAGDEKSSSIKVDVYITNDSIVSNLSGNKLPIYSIKDNLNAISIFVDMNHKLFKESSIVPEQLIASEIAERIKLLNTFGNDIEGINTIPLISTEIINKYWIERLGESREILLERINQLMETIKQRLVLTVESDAEQYYDMLSDEQSKTLALNIINAGESIDKISEFKKNGSFLQYVSNDFIISLYNIKPSLFFDGKVWDELYENIAVPDEMKRIAQESIKCMYGLCLEDINTFSTLNTRDHLFVRKTMCSINFLMQKVNMDVY